MLRKSPRPRRPESPSSRSLRKMNSCFRRMLSAVGMQYQAAAVGRLRPAACGAAPRKQLTPLDPLLSLHLALKAADNPVQDEAHLALLHTILTTALAQRALAASLGLCVMLRCSAQIQGPDLALLALAVPVVAPLRSARRLALGWQCVVDRRAGRAIRAARRSHNRANRARRVLLAGRDDRRRHAQLLHARCMLVNPARLCEEAAAHLREKAAARRRSAAPGLAAQRRAHPLELAELVQPV
mmetsp:Transcript_18450/g.62055  ORF Transcript_18450/g.62055 Transcript_18450/m.62055 type:complete len:241 (-) Transcript_18450:3-725(-)